MPAGRHAEQIWLDTLGTEKLGKGWTGPLGQYLVVSEIYCKIIWYTVGMIINYLLQVWVFLII